jgi:uncharacterized RDD family membrane protein YckC
MMTLQTFCPACGAALVAGAQFCTNCGHHVAGSVVVHGGATAAGKANYQVVGRRILAGLIDFIPLIIMFFVLAATIGQLGEDERGNFQVRLYNEDFLVFVVFALAYYIGFEAITAATPGKMMMGLRVIKVNGEACGLREVLIRNLLRIVDGFFFYVVAVVAIAITQKRQRIGDLAAGTLVVAT